MALLPRQQRLGVCSAALASIRRISQEHGFLKMSKVNKVTFSDIPFAFQFFYVVPLIQWRFLTCKDALKYLLRRPAAAYGTSVAIVEGKSW